MSEGPQPQHEGTMHPGDQIGSSLPKLLPFRERIPQPALEYRPVLGRWLALLSRGL